MNIPVTIDQFFEVLREYNTSVFPMQIVLNILALSVVFFSIKKKKYSDQFAGYTLGFLWLWMGIAYHLSFFAEINPAAYIFAIRIDFYSEIPNREEVLGYNFSSDHIQLMCY